MFFMQSFLGIVVSASVASKLDTIHDSGNARSHKFFQPGWLVLLKQITAVYPSGLFILLETLKKLSARLLPITVILQVCNGLGKDRV